VINKIFDFLLGLIGDSESENDEIFDAELKVIEREKIKKLRRR